MQGTPKTIRSLILVALFGLALAGCDSNDNDKSNGGSAASSASSTSSSASSSSSSSGFTLSNVQVHFPPSVSSSNAETLTIRGSVTDATEVSRVLVNGTEVNSSDALASWTLEVPLAGGTNKFEVTYEDANGESNAVTTLSVSQQLELVSPKRMALDETSSRLLVLDTTLSALIGINTVSGDKTVFSPTDESTNLFGTPRGLDVDAANSRAVVFQNSDDGDFIAIDLASGEQSALPSSDLTSPPSANSPTALEIASAATYYVADSEWLYFDADENYTTDEDLAIVELPSAIIYKYDPATGNKTIVSSYQTPDTEVRPDHIFAIADDPSSNTLYALDVYTAFGTQQPYYRLLAVDKTTGKRTLLLPQQESTNADGDDYYELRSPKDIWFNPASNSLWMLDGNALVALNPEKLTGEVISSNSVPEDGDYRLLAPQDFSVPANAATAYIVDESYDWVLAVNPTDGARSYLSGRGDNPSGRDQLLAPADITLDRANSTAYITDKLLGTIFKYDLNSGTKTVLAKGSNEDDTFLVYPLTSSFGPEPDTLYVLDNYNQRPDAIANGSSYQRFIGIDTNSGEQTRLRSFSNASHTFRDIAYSPMTGLFYTAENNYISRLRQDSTGFSYSYFSFASDENRNNQFRNLRALAVDDRNNRLLTLDAGVNAITAVDMDSGARTIFSGMDEPESPVDFNQPIAIVMDYSRNRALVMDSSLKGIVAVDLDTAERTLIFSDPALASVRDIELFEELNYLLLVDDFSDSLMAVDLVSQEMVILTN